MSTLIFEFFPKGATTLLVTGRKSYHDHLIGLYTHSPIRIDDGKETVYLPCPFLTNTSVFNSPPLPCSEYKPKMRFSVYKVYFSLPENRLCFESPILNKLKTNRGVSTGFSFSSYKKDS